MWHYKYMCVLKIRKDYVYVCIYTVSQKLDPFLSDHNFNKYRLILIIPSLLQTEINCHQAYLKSTTKPQISRALNCKMNRNVLTIVAGTIS